jgi:hypothetical protein
MLIEMAGTTLASAVTDARAGHDDGETCYFTFWMRSMRPES